MTLTPAVLALLLINPLGANAQREEPGSAYQCEEVAKGQALLAVIVTCSDRRLDDNFIFDQEQGRLFTVREAGNRLKTQSLASMEYAVEHLRSRVNVVPTHNNIVRYLCQAGKLAIVPTGYDLVSGQIRLLPVVPENAPKAEPHH